jgi:hypothetical protein
MAEFRPPQPVELVIGVIVGERASLDRVRQELEAEFGQVESASPSYDFDVTDYYLGEMGPGLRRVFFSFVNMIDPAGIVETKLASNRIEAAYSRGGRRTANIDPGYMDLYKLVLASAKFQGQKVYLGKGVYADPTIYYDRGWKPYRWGFPDFIGGRYNTYLTQVRNMYKAKIRRLGSGPAFVERSM